MFKIKKDGQGNIERFKARLVVKGFLQQEGIDFSEVYAPVSKHVALRALLSVACTHELELRQLDAKTAFLNGELEEDIYMLQPPGYEERGPDIVCKLQKALYGLKQAPRAWHLKLKAALEQLDFIASNADPSLFIKAGPDPIYVLVYVDDIIIGCRHLTMVDSTVKLLGNLFDIRELGEPKHFLGMELQRDRAAGIIKLSNQRAITNLLQQYGMQDCKPISTPFPAGTQLTAESSNPAPPGYSNLVGSLLYMSITTRPDIAVGVLDVTCPSPAQRTTLQPKEFYAIWQAPRISASPTLPPVTPYTATPTLIMLEIWTPGDQPQGIASSMLEESFPGAADYSTQLQSLLQKLSTWLPQPASRKHSGFVNCGRTWDYKTQDHSESTLIIKPQSVCYATQ